MIVRGVGLKRDARGLKQPASRWKMSRNLAEIVAKNDGRWLGPSGVSSVHVAWELELRRARQETMALLALLRHSNGIVPRAPREALASTLGLVTPSRAPALAPTASRVATIAPPPRASSHGGARVMASNVKEVLPKFHSEFRRPRRIKDRGRAVVSDPCAAATACQPAHTHHQARGVCSIACAAHDSGVPLTSWRHTLR